MQKKQVPSLAPQGNSFALTFDIERLPGNKFNRGQMAYSFEAPQCPELESGGHLTELGYRILITTLTDVILNLAEMAEKHTNLKASALKNGVAARMEVRGEGKRLILPNNRKIIAP